MSLDEPKYVTINALSPLPFPGKIQLLFAIFGLLTPGNRAGSQVKGLESKLIPGQLPVKNFWFQHFFQFCGYRSQKTFQKKFHSNFQVWLLFLVQRLPFSEKWSRIWCWIDWHQFENPKMKKKKLVCPFQIVLLYVRIKLDSTNKFSVMYMYVFSLQRFRYN